MKGFLQNKDLIQVYFILPLFLFFVFIFVFGANLLLRFWNESNKLVNPPFKISTNFYYPIIKNKFNPQISATGAIIMDADSKVVLYSKNKDFRFSSASTTKIMTSVVASEYFKPEDILIVKSGKVEGSKLGLLIDEKMTFENLMYAMMLPSANDAALVISENYPGGEKEFVKKMNAKAQVFNLKNTHYGDPIGLADSQDYTTPFDLASLASFAIKNPLIAKVVNTKYKIISDTTGLNTYAIQNLNELLGEDGVNGVKTGFTEEAGQVLVTSKKEKNKTLIIVVMGSQDRFLDTRRLLDLLRDNITYLPLHP